FRLSVKRALRFEATYLDYLLDGKVVSSRDFQKALRCLPGDEEDDLAVGSVADELDEVAEAKRLIDALPKGDLNEDDLRALREDVENDVETLRDLYDRTEPLVAADGKLKRLQGLLGKELRGRKVLIFSSFKDTARYLEQRLTNDAAWMRAAGRPNLRRIDSSN